MELTIDTFGCDLGTNRIRIPGFGAAALADPNEAREGRSLKITIPATPRNDALVGGARDLRAEPRFNMERHTAVLTADGARLLAGTVRLLAVTDEGYTLEIRDGGAQWAENAARRMFNTLGVEYAAQLTPTVICDSWTGDTPVRFFPIHRDEYEQQSGASDLLPAERLLSVDDYHPFLHVATLVEQLFAEAGYRIRSRFFASEFFRSLYMSGAYVSHDTTAVEARMGFSARRLAPATAAADLLGRVYANPASTLNSVGNIVETATPQSVDADGEAVAGLYNNGNCFTTENGAIRFTPPTEVSAGFEYRLRYTTDHRILSRTRLTGFDSFYLGAGNRMTFTLANRYADRRGELSANYTYRVIVFNHGEGGSYLLTYTCDGVAGTTWCEFAARSASVTTPAGKTLSTPRLFIRRGEAWAPYVGDWALYDGYVGETGQTTVDVRLRTVAERLSPSSPKRFHDIFFYGAEEGMTLTLHKECSLRPLFASSPGFGSQIAFADVARHAVRQIELLEALAHLFNLRFYTEPESRSVWIEPEAEFFGSGPEVDWSGRTDFAQGVERQEIAPEIHERRTWGYQAGDGAVSRYEAEQQTEFGRWSRDTASRAAQQGEQTRLNPLFSPSLDSVGHYLNAPSARILQVGDRDDAESDGTNFTPRIVRYAGMHPLAEGERWGYPSDEPTYPLAAFHFEGDGTLEPFTLCFEDRDGAQGLHRYYDRQAAREERYERITLTLRIDPDEYEALLTPGTGGAELRSIFRIDSGGGVVRATLHALGEYDPEARCARCTFNRLAEEGTA